MTILSAASLLSTGAGLAGQLVNSVQNAVSGGAHGGHHHSLPPGSVAGASANADLTNAGQPASGTSAAGPSFASTLLQSLGALNTPSVTAGATGLTAAARHPIPAMPRTIRS